MNRNRYRVKQLVVLAALAVLGATRVRTGQESSE
jgi:hypothetical protein